MLRVCERDEELFSWCCVENEMCLFVWSGYEKLEHGTSRSFVVSHQDDIGEVSRVEVYWEYDMNVLQPRSICFLWCNDHLYVASVRISASRIINARE